VYPRHCAIPTPESEGFVGRPEPTNEGYGWAKRMEEFLGQAYADEFAMKVAIARPYNCYGPRDNFDPASSHVIPALIRKCLEARDEGCREVACWGTGNATREFLFVEDCADALVLATERYDGADPVNIGSGFEISIRDLAHLIAELCGFEGTLRFDPSQPDGQPRRLLDVTRAASAFGFRANTDFRVGLRRTIDWYERHRAGVPAGV
jgi:GDP-L-fucose synthase